MEEFVERIPKIARTNLSNAHDGFLKGNRDLTIPPNSTTSLLLDQTYLVNAYPELILSGGKGGFIKVSYAEALFDKDMQKGHRDEIEAREVIGHYDEFLPDGGARRIFKPLWFRTYRYIQLDISTKDDPLVLHDLYGVFTGYPFKENASFSSNDQSLKKIWDIGWRTARLCALETYVDCPYYEQLQYIGDTRIQALISFYVSGDDRLVRNALAQFDNSRIPEGLTASRYPHALQQIIPPYSLFHIAMVHDYWMHRDDPEFVKSFYPGIQGILGWFERHLDTNDMLTDLPWWNFVDHVNFHGDKTEPIGKDEHTSNITLQFIYALNYAAELATAFNYESDATYYKRLAERLKKAIYDLCWDDNRGLLADTPEKLHYSQHANIFVILTDLIPKEKQAELMEKILDDKSLTHTTIYFNFY